MAAEWQVMSLREGGVALIDCDHRTPPAAPTGFPYVAIPQLRAGRIDLSGVRRISPEHFKEWTQKACPRAFDVVLSRRCNPGETAFVPPGLPFALGQNLVLLRSDGIKVLPEFLRWLVRGPAWSEQVQKFLNVGAIFDSLRCADVPNFELPIPPLDVQLDITRVLGTLDDKIELNRRMNETLEAMARALFKSWFVDFDPVRAKAEGRTQPGMDAATVTLFPSELVESEVGSIPKSWRFGTLGEFVDLQRGTTYKSALKGQRGPVLLGLGTIQRNGGFREDKLVTYGGDSPEKLLVRPGGLYVSLKDVTQSADLLGAVARVPPYVKIGRLTQDTVKLVFRDDETMREVLFRTLLTGEYREYCRQHATGTTNLALSRDDFLGYPLVVPTPEILARFNSIISPISACIESNFGEIRSLARTRDELLPRLLSGELSVAHAGREMEVVA